MFLIQGLKDPANRGNSWILWIKANNRQNVVSTSLIRPDARYGVVSTLKRRPRVTVTEGCRTKREENRECEIESVITVHASSTEKL